MASLVSFSSSLLCNKMICIAVFSAAILLSSVSASSSRLTRFDTFVKTKGSQFVVNGRPAYFNGFNAYYLTYIAMESPSTVSQIFGQAASAGLTLCRTWGFNDGSYHALQISPGNYDEKAFRALDFVLSEAKRNGIRVILSLSDNYPNMGGKAQYVQWAKNQGVWLSSDDDFYTNPTVKGYYKNYVKYVLTRVNTISGVSYKDDPTVFAWELMNEARDLSDASGDKLYAWIEEMSGFIKSIDSNHMVEAGLEGFYGPSTPDKQQYNPSGMNLMTGTDYIRFNKIPNIDFATVHSYPDIWLPGSSFEQQVEFLKRWVDSHISDSNLIDKPVLFTEFGFSSHNQFYSEETRETFYNAMYSPVYASAAVGGPAAGTLVWQLCTYELENNLATDGYGVVLSPNLRTTSLIAAQSEKLLALSQ